MSLGAAILSPLCKPGMELITTTEELAATCERLAQPPLRHHRHRIPPRDHLLPAALRGAAGVERRGRGDRCARARHRPQAVLRADGERAACSRCSTPPARTSKSVWHRAQTSSRIRFSTPRSRPWCWATAIPSPTTSSCSASPATRSTSRTASPTGPGGRCRRPRSPTRSPTSPICATSTRALVADLGRRGRTDWMDDEMEILTSPDTYRADPARAWMRLKTRVRKPKELAVLIEVAAWREREAQSRDVPRSRVLKDDTIGDIAMQAPTTPERLASLRSLPKGFERSKWGEGILEAVQARARARSEIAAADRAPEDGAEWRGHRRTAQGAAAHDLGAARRRRQGDRHGRRSRPHRRRRRGRRAGAARAGGASCSARGRWTSSTAGWRWRSSAAAWSRSSAINRRRRPAHPEQIFEQPAAAVAPDHGDLAPSAASASGTS